MGRAVPGFLGSGFAMLFFKDPNRWRQLGLFMAGLSMAYYATDFVSAKTGLGQNLAGFLVGMFSMAIIQKIFDVWQTFDLGPIVRDALRKWLGLAPKGDIPTPPSIL